VDKPGIQTRVLDWSRDGRYLVEERSDGDIWILPLFGDKKPFPYVRTTFHEEFAKVSPNGQWLAYDSNELKRADVYVGTFPKPGGKWQISTSGGSHPVWSHDGSELYFISPDKKMMAVKIRNEPNFEHGVPQPLFDSRFVDGPNAWFDVSKDGQFLIPALVGQSTNLSIKIVVNWTASLKK
jgi:hypothetical protein